MSTPPRLPATLQVLERGWLSANNVLLFDGGEATLVDSGYVTHAAQTVALLRAALGGRRLGRLVNTHSHSDHIGGNAAVQRAFGCRITVPKGMAQAVADWDEAALLLSVIDQAGEPFQADATLDADSRFVAGELEWQAIAAPGHDMDALAYYNAERRILMSGDALWRDGFGILFADVLGTGDALGEARRTLEAIGRLAVDAVIPGHGAPFAEFDDALERAFARLRAFEADGARMARNAIRACITFRLLDVRRMALDELPRHLDETPLYREANRRFLGLAPDALAAWLVKELERAGVARREHDSLVAN
ncbi:MBL fold metallo-hydrolase [Thauera linaloolentis]|uniref:Beta-lactamase n=1 Tax=Thauera linaloolentis (strain DSM 12138 / JCM 21573 / CCUG 41526 / CIP 105981 / IAM 15112 / NBRC 102519 / 47Lol) TaxID=1123367 RepID=N6Z1C7_THAL4|nr:MBL fold metallo-hydrolase [Thauera linaloolentis]ENO88218.1 beta-lactamase [Thauera linaloolentis 47Lol = DSM 12138]MCM8566865.1 MBL fold metallo-hydrolase [Thauera linaloolentis]